MAGGKEPESSQDRPDPMGSYHALWQAELLTRAANLHSARALVKISGSNTEDSGLKAEADHLVRQSDLVGDAAMVISKVYQERGLTPPPGLFGVVADGVEVINSPQVIDKRGFRAVLGNGLKRLTSLFNREEVKAAEPERLMLNPPAPAVVIEASPVVVEVETPVSEPVEIAAPEVNPPLITEQAVVAKDATPQINLKRPGSKAKARVVDIKPSLPKDNTPAFSKLLDEQVKAMAFGKESMVLTRAEVLKVFGGFEQNKGWVEGNTQASLGWVMRQYRDYLHELGVDYINIAPKPQPMEIVLGYYLRPGETPPAIIPPASKNGQLRAPTAGPGRVKDLVGTARSGKQAEAADDEEDEDNRDEAELKGPSKAALGRIQKDGVKIDPDLLPAEDEAVHTVNGSVDGVVAGHVQITADDRNRAIGADAIREAHRATEQLAVNVRLGGSIVRTLANIGSLRAIGSDPVTQVKGAYSGSSLATELSGQLKGLSARETRALAVEKIADAAAMLLEDPDKIPLTAANGPVIRGIKVLREVGTTPNGLRKIVSDRWL